MTKKALTKDQQYKVFTYYVGAGFKLATPYLSPLPLTVRGKVDKESSFNIYEVNDNLRWKDFGGGEDLNGDAIEFIIHMEDYIYNLPQREQFKEALNFFHNKIENSRYLDRDLVLKQAKNSSSKHKDKNPIVHYTSEYDLYEKYYWYSRYKMDVNFLVDQRTYALRGIDWGDGIKNPSTSNDPAFVTDMSEKGDMSSWKVYRPLSKNKRFKWKSWNLSVVPFEGYYLLPKYGERLLITSGRKDGYTSLMLDQIYKGYFDWSVGNPTGENAWKRMLKYMGELKSRFSWIGGIFDGDLTGIEAAKEFHDMTGAEFFFLEYPLKTGERLQYAKENGLSLYTKDVSEIVENYDYAKLFQIITECTNRTPYIK